MIRKLSLLLFSMFLLTAFPQQSFAQKKKKQQLPDENVYLLKADWTGASSMDDATYFMQIIKQSDSAYVCRYYQKFGPMVRQESFRDEGLSIPYGRFCWYNEKGELDSIGLVVNGKKDNYWNYYKNGKSILTIKYDNGRVINKTDYMAKIFTDENGIKISLDEKNKADSIYNDSIKTTQVEAKFKNGSQDWVEYIQKNLTTPDRLINVLGTGKHEATVVFMVSKEGNIDPDIYLIKSVEWSGDREIFRLIQNSPPWKPAMQDGRPVFYRQKQTLTFQVAQG